MISIKINVFFLFNYIFIFVGVSFPEWIIGLSVLADGLVTDKLAFLFALFAQSNIQDATDSAYLSRNQFLSLNMCLLYVLMALSSLSKDSNWNSFVLNSRRTARRLVLNTLEDFFGTAYLKHENHVSFDEWVQWREDVPGSFVWIDFIPSSLNNSTSYVEAAENSFESLKSPNSTKQSYKKSRADSSSYGAASPLSRYDSYAEYGGDDEEEPYEEESISRNQTTRNQMSGYTPSVYEPSRPPSSPERNFKKEAASACMFYIGVLNLYSFSILP